MGAERTLLVRVKPGRYVDPATRRVWHRVTPDMSLVLKEHLRGGLYRKNVGGRVLEIRPVSDFRLISWPNFRRRARGGLDK